MQSFNLFYKKEPDKTKKSAFVLCQNEIQKAIMLEVGHFMHSQIWSLQKRKESCVKRQRKKEKLFWPICKTIYVMYCVINTTHIFSKHYI